MGVQWPKRGVTMILTIAAQAQNIQNIGVGLNHVIGTDIRCKKLFGKKCHNVPE